MESQPQTPEFRINPENFLSCNINLFKTGILFMGHPQKLSKQTRRHRTRYMIRLCPVCLQNSLLIFEYN